jgi:ATP-dependent DNA helicase RecG
VVVGTHALIQKGFEFRDLAVAVVDEQHRFGVEQRSALTEGRAPHVLHMTATPIPRTLALTVYGDLSVSEIAKPPASRKPIVNGLGDRRAQLRGVHAPASNTLQKGGRRTSSAR